MYSVYYSIFIYLLFNLCTHYLELKVFNLMMTCKVALLG